MVEQLTGRLKKPPHESYTNTVLYPQFKFELDNYLSHYLAIEKVLLQMYEQMNILSASEAEAIAKAINNLDKEELHIASKENLTDIAFTIEKAVKEKVKEPVPFWHLDRSRNDFQACAQLMYGRENWMELIQKMLDLSKAIIRKIDEYPSTLMLGYTHYQSAQVINVSFYLTAIHAHILETIRKMLLTLDFINGRCPLGSGSMSGQELKVDNNLMAKKLGFQGYVGHALVGVSSRDWLLSIGETVSYFASNMSRFLSDLLNWGSSEYRYIDFPDELSGISSSMPQKRNYPILERARGKTGYLINYYIGFLMGQRNTPFSNLVEVSKESSKDLPLLFHETNRLIDLLMLIFDNISFVPERMKERCDAEFIGGFSLANQLTIRNGIPYRQSQVIAGEFITASMKLDVQPVDLSIELLNTICLEYGYKNHLTEKELKDLFNSENESRRKKSVGSSNPDSVKEITSKQIDFAAKLEADFSDMAGSVHSALTRLNSWPDKRE